MTTHDMNHPPHDNPATLAYPLVGDTAATRAALERILTEAMLPFWRQDPICTADEGYHLHYDAHGRDLGPAPRHLVSQARMVWFFARLARSPYAQPADAQRAAHGFDFMRRRMLDARHGGFHWTVDAKGNVTDATKHLYGQAFALFALSEYIALTDDAEARSLAAALWRIIDAVARDSTHGGYIELWQGDWSPQRNAKVWHMGAPAGAKTLNTHLHLLEAFTAYLRVQDDAEVAARVDALHEILTGCVVRPPGALTTDKFTVEWSPRSDRVSYGHDVERAWLLLDACDALRRDRAATIAYSERIFDDVLRLGYDHDHGGLFSEGPLGQPADDRRKHWWPQAELLIAAAYMYCATGQPRYAACFSRTLDWVMRRQVDWSAGDWHRVITPDGHVEGNKADAWKTAYHAGRAMLMCLAMLPVGDAAARLRR